MSNTASASFKNTHEFQYKNPSREDTVEDYGLEKNVITNDKTHDKTHDKTVEHILITKYKTDPNSLKRINRHINAQVSEEKYQELMKQRNELVSNEFESGLTDKEKRKLEMLRWEIECIEDARYGEHLDKLEHLIILKKELARQVKYFVDEANYLKLKKEKMRFGR